MTSPDDIFPQLAGSKTYSSFNFHKGYYGIQMQKGVKKLHNIGVLKWPDKIKSYALWHDKLRLYI